MGDPKKSRKKYKRPKRLWDKRRIAEESALKRKYGLKNMRELWIAKAELTKVRRVARQLLALPAEVREREQKKVLAKLNRYGILPENATLDDILSLTVEHFLERRLQTVVYRKGLARTIKQARQLIVHGFIALDGRRVDTPGRFITKEEEEKITYFKPIDLTPKQAVGEEEKAPEGASEGAEGEKAQEAQGATPQANA